MKTRRGFLKNGALALVGTAAIRSFLTRGVMAQAPGGRASRKKLVVIFQRGAADGLNIVVPHAEPSYFQMRPTIAIPQGQILDLDGFFGLHPAMASLKPLWDQKHLAIVHAVGSPEMTRSHFDAQDYMESGTPGIKATEDGWLNRALQAEDERRRQAETPFRAVALTAEMPRTLEGRVRAVALNNIRNFHVGGARTSANASFANSFEGLYDESSDTALRGAGREVFEAAKVLQATDPAR